MKIVRRRQNEAPRYKRFLRVKFHRMFPTHQDAVKVGWSVAAGVFIGIWPTIGVAILLTIAFCTLFNLPKVPGTVSSFVANPITQFGFFYPTGYKLGCSILSPEKIPFDFLSRFEDISIKNATFIIRELWNTASGHLAAFLLGITIIAAIFGFIFFWIGYGIVTYRKKRSIALKNKYLKQLLQEDSEIFRQANDSEKLAEKQEGTSP